MWRWLQNGRKADRLWTHIIAGCTALHGVVLVMLFLVYRGDVANYRISTSSTLTSQQVILLPMYKVVGDTRSKTRAIAAPVAQAIDTRNVAVERKQAPKEEKATTLAPAPNKKAAPKKAKKKKARASKKSKKVDKKKSSVKKIEAKKEEPKKIEPAPVVQSTDNQVAMSLPADAQSTIYVGQLELEALQLQEAVQRELQTYWKPPIGHKGLTCNVTVMVDWQGVISEITITQSSGVLMFDMSAEQALSAMTFPKTAWGKNITITFS